MPKSVVVGHRIVHGGSKFYDPVIITDEVKRAIASASAIAPLHNRAELEAVELIEGLMGRIQQVAVFDQAFINIFRPPRPYIQDRTNGSSAAFGATAFTESIMNIAPGAPLSCSESRWTSFG